MKSKSSYRPSFDSSARQLNRKKHNADHENMIHRSIPLFLLPSFRIRDVISVNKKEGTLSASVLWDSATLIQLPHNYKAEGEPL